MTKPPVDLWAPLPIRLRTALVRGEIDLDEYALGTYFAQVAFENKNTHDGIVLVRLAALAEEIGWSKTQQTLREKVKGLADKGWISVRVEERQRGPWEIRLLGLARDADCKTTARSEGPPILQSAEVVLQSSNGVTPLGERDSDSSQASASCSSVQTDETRLDTACINGAVGSADVGLTPDVDGEHERSELRPVLDQVQESEIGGALLGRTKERASRSFLEEEDRRMAEKFLSQVRVKS